MSLTPSPAPDDSPPQLVRGLTLFPATALNMVDMVGVGPFITLPLIVAAMGGAQAIFGWMAGAILAMSDGLIWAELGAAMPKAGGSYEYLEEIYGRKKLGRMLSFLFVFQLVFTAPVSMATGCVGLANYGSYLFPALGHTFWTNTLHLRLIGDIDLPIELSGGTILAMAAAFLATLLVHRKIAAVGRISKFLWVGVMAALAFVIFTCLTHFQFRLAFPAGWLNAPPSGLWSGFSAALLIATYDYWGYYNICFLAEEVVEPQKTIPRSMLLSIVLVAILYIMMNIGLLGVLPAKEIASMAGGAAGNFPAARAAQVVYGPWGGTLVSLLVMWTAFASVFSLLAGYSRIPFAAARDGNFFSSFQKIHPQHKFPIVSALVLGGLAGLLCVFQLKDLVSGLVVIRIMLLFGVQAVGAVIWRKTNPGHPRPFRMWLYPLPVIITLAGFALILYDKRSLFFRGLLFAALGIAVYLFRSAKRREWPFERLSA